MSCCSEYGCRRQTPILVRRAAFSGSWVAITAHTSDGALIKASQKHVLDPVSHAEIELCGSVLRDLFEHVRTEYYATEDDSESERAYRDVLDKLAELEKAKRTELFGVGDQE